MSLSRRQPPKFVKDVGRVLIVAGFSTVREGLLEQRLRSDVVAEIVGPQDAEKFPIAESVVGVPQTQAECGALLTETNGLLAIAASVGNAPKIPEAVRNADEVPGG